MKIKPRTVILFLAVAVFLILQVFPRVRLDNPPVTGEIQAPPEVINILRESCFDCHSNRTRWPWYSRVAPVSWLITHDVQEAREKMNFSAWADIPLPSRAHYIHEIVEHVEEKEMPLSRYLYLHPRAGVTQAGLEILRNWEESQKISDDQ